MGIRAALVANLDPRGKIRAAIDRSILTEERSVNMVVRVSKIVALVIFGVAVSFNSQSAMALQKSKSDRFPRRVALLIGNSDYQKNPLQNPVNDVKAMAEALTGIGFVVTERLNRTKAQFESDIDEITDDLQTGDVCLVFYAGHGQSYEDINYLIPIGATVSRPHHLKERCVRMNYVQSALEESDASMKVLILDSCRDPIVTTNRGGAQGFAQIPPPDGILVAFSTAPGEFASDGTGDTSPFTENIVAILKQERPQGLTMLDLFFETGRAMKESIGQRPYLAELDTTMDRFWLIPSSSTVEKSPTDKTSVREISRNYPVKADWGIRVADHNNGNGMVVTRVVKGSPARRGTRIGDDVNFYKLDPGDVILAINGVAINDSEEFESEFQKSATRMAVTVSDVRNANQTTIYFNLEKE